MSGYFCPRLWMIHKLWEPGYISPLGITSSLIPSFLDDRESLFERAILHDDFAEPFHEGPQSRFGHSRDQFVEHAALAEERMGAMLGGVGLEMAVHAETFSG